MLSRTVQKQKSLTQIAHIRTFASAGNSLWTDITAAPADPIMGLSEAFKKDSNPNKQNLGIGAYRDNAGKPYILVCVR